LSDRLKEIDRRIEELKFEYDNSKGTPTETYTRIVGYFRAVENWNSGKREEYFDRKTFKVKETK
jgi:ribonucleoside-triphosphate reductase